MATNDSKEPPMPLSPLPGRPISSRESLTFKALLVASALFLGSLVVATQEFYFSAPGYSLSETEAALPLASR
jgi:hypothetical protein